MPAQAIAVPVASTEPPSTGTLHEVEPRFAPWKIWLDGFLQPQFRTRQNSAAQFDEEGFRFKLARVVLHTSTTAGSVDISSFIEVELQPTFEMVDALVTATRKLPHHGQIVLDVGQMRVPISRQQLLSDARLAFVDKGQIATLAPRRDLGARLTLVVPKLPQLRVIGGAFNGEGPNQVQNINEKYLYAGRVEVTPLGHETQLSESSFSGNFLTIAASVGLNKLTAGTRKEDVRYLGFDISGAYKGISGSFEYLQVDHEYSEAGAMTVEDFRANGFVAQLNYLMPVQLPPHQQGRLEIGARLEEIDRNDTIPIAQIGDPEQSVRQMTGVVSFYLRKHSLKAQLAFSHFEEIEDMTSVGEDAVYDNDQLLLQVTYRWE